jgi:hypothetical protein
MATDVVGSRIYGDLQMEKVTLCNDYGAVMLLQIAVSDSANRASLIAGAQALGDANQTALEAYATAHSLDISADKTAGLAKKAALLLSNGE